MLRTTIRAAATALAIAGALLSGAAAASLSVYISYADWCGPCQVLMPKLDAAAARFPEGEIDLVKLDFTEMSVENLDRQFARAGPLAPGDFMEEGRFLKTGFAYLVVGGSVEGQVSAGLAVDDIVAQFRSALGR